MKKKTGGAFMNMNGRVALVTGAAAGIGKAVALKLAEYGAKLILLDVNLEKLQVLQEELSQYTSEVLIERCDISDEACVEKVVAKATERFERIDILVNNAAIWRGWMETVDTPSEVWKRFLDVNVMGTVYMTNAVLRGMQERRWGRIINVASVAGVYGIRRMAPYSASKGAVISMTKALAREVAEFGITVNSVSPGTVSPAENEDVNYTEPNSMSYMGRTGSGNENAELICYLASDAAAYISGENMIIDGCRKTL